jgi:hypothetical protein
LSKFSIKVLVIKPHLLSKYVTNVCVCFEKTNTVKMEVIFPTATCIWNKERRRFLYMTIRWIKNKQFTYNVTMRSVRVTIVVVESNEDYIIYVCVYL